MVQRIEQAVERAVRGKREVVRLLLAALFARGHVLIEDVPGVGKTTLARALAACLGGTFRRIQFTSDLLPSDILGVNVYRAESGAFEFKPGPIFAHVVLADEINRTTPRTQSSLMEALNEGQVTVDNHTYPLESPFLVIATQNPVEHFGTYPLPESQMDRFLLRVTMGYPAHDDERRLIAEGGGLDAVASLEPVVTLDQVRAMQEVVDQVRVDPALLDYVMTVVAETRRSPHLALGVSTRGAIAWYRAAQAFALVQGRDYCVPDDVKQLAPSVLAHRVILSGQQEALAQGRDEAEQVIAELLARLPVPL
ncbi:MAG: MoxR family ATPase [Deltaproteobacteria bacterium]|nr:MoxR family ATPase [Deltaproteobacteria bacterium]